MKKERRKKKRAEWLMILIIGVRERGIGGVPVTGD